MNKTPDKKTKTPTCKNKKKTIIAIVIVFSIIAGGALFVSLSNHIVVEKCRGEKSGICVVMGDTFRPVRVDWNKKPDKYGDARDHMTPEEIEMYEELGRKESF